MKSHVGFWLAYLDLTMAYSKGQGNGHAHFDCEYCKAPRRSRVTTTPTGRLGYDGVLTIGG